MQARLDALRELIANPSGDFNATAVAILIIVLLVVIVALVLIAVALPSRAARPARKRRDTRSKAQAAGPDDEVTLTPLTPRRRALGAKGCAAVSALLLFGFSVSAVVWYDVTSTNTYCGQTCHAMAAPTASWKLSAHKKVACVRCHEGPAGSSVLRAVTLRTYSLYLQATGATPRPLRVPSATCVSCHRPMLGRRFTALNGEIFTHRDFAEKSCRDCHKNQGHIPPGADEAKPTL